MAALAFLAQSLLALGASHLVAGLGATLVTLVGVRMAHGVAHARRRARTVRAHEQAIQARVRSTLAQAGERSRTSTVHDGRWHGPRHFLVERVEALPTGRSGLFDIWIRPEDGKPLPTWQPGQYLPVRIRLPGSSDPAIRCYSLSTAWRRDRARLVVRGIPDGRAASFFRADLAPGTRFEAFAPRGSFVLDPDDPTPVVAVAGGIGITPLLALCDAALQGDALPELYVFHGVRGPDQEIHAEVLESLAAATDPDRVGIYWSRTDPAVPTPPLRHRGRADLATLQARLPARALDTHLFLLCGPAPFLHGWVADLRAAGVPASRIRTEPFGARSVRAIAEALAPAPSENGLGALAPSCHGVTFRRRRKIVTWAAHSGDLLRFAEIQGVEIPAGCRTGGCGACAVGLQEGSVRYLRTPDHPIPQGMCLPCVAQPTSNVVLDA